MTDRDELLRLLTRGLRDKASLTAGDWKRIREIDRALLRIAEEPGTGPEKAAIAWKALKP